MAELIAKGTHSQTFALFPYRRGRAFAWSFHAVFYAPILLFRDGTNTGLRSSNTTCSPRERFRLAHLVRKGKVSGGMAAC